MADRPNVTVQSLGNSTYRVSYEMYLSGQTLTHVQASVNSSSVLEFNASAGPSNFEDQSKPIPGGISIVSQKTTGNKHVVTVTCAVDLTQYIE